MLSFGVARVRPIMSHTHTLCLYRCVHVRTRACLRWRVCLPPPPLSQSGFLLWLRVRGSFSLTHKHTRPLSFRTMTGGGGARLYGNKLNDESARILAPALLPCIHLRHLEYVCVPVYLGQYVCTPVCTCLYVRTSAYAPVCMCLCACAPVCVSVCLYQCPMRLCLCPIPLCLCGSACRRVHVCTTWPDVRPSCVSLCTVCSTTT
jgi:hypothetical protein